MLPLKICIRNLFLSSPHLSSLLKTKQRQYLSLSSEIFKSSFLLMPPFSFWHVLAHPHLSKGLKRPNTRVKQKLPVQLLFFSERIPFKAVDTVQSPAQRFLLSFELSYRPPQLLHRTQLSRGCLFSCPTEMSWASKAAEVTPWSDNSIDFSLSAYRAGQKIIFQDTSQHQFTSFILDILVPLQARQISTASCNAGLCFLRICICENYDCLLFSNNKLVHF